MKGLADLLFPSRCVGCERLVRGALCLDCIQAVPTPGPSICAFCGGPVPAPAPECRECRGRGYRFDRARQAAEFTRTVRLAIHRYKYASERCLSGSLSLLLASQVDRRFDGVVTWVPAQPNRVRRRGFDHGRELARSLAQRVGVPAEEALHRVRRTMPQVGLEPGVRRSNVAGAFAARTPVSGKFLVVDDVFTTGATASEAAGALKMAGASFVEVVCVARAFGEPSRKSRLALSQAGQ